MKHSMTVSSDIDTPTLDNTSFIDNYKIFKKPKNNSSTHQFIHPFICAFIHPFIGASSFHSMLRLIHPLLNSPIHLPEFNSSYLLRIHQLNHAFIHLTIYSPIHSLRHLPTHSFIHPFTHSPTDAPIHLYMHSIIHQPMHPPSHPSIYLCMHACMHSTFIHWRLHFSDA